MASATSPQRLGVGLISVDKSWGGGSRHDTINVTLTNLDSDQYVHNWKLKVTAKESWASESFFAEQPHFCFPFIWCHCHWVFEDHSEEITVNDDANYKGELIDQILIVSAGGQTGLCNWLYLVILFTLCAVLVF
jgi:hypothetical protein